MSPLLPFFDNSTAMVSSTSVSFNFDIRGTVSPCCSPKHTKTSMCCEKSTVGTGSPGFLVWFIWE